MTVCQQYWSVWMLLMLAMRWGAMTSKFRQYSPVNKETGCCFCSSGFQGLAGILATTITTFTDYSTHDQLTTHACACVSVLN